MSINEILFSICPVRQVNFNETVSITYLVLIVEGGKYFSPSFFEIYLMKIITTLKNSSHLVTTVSDSVRKAKSGYPLSEKQLEKRLSVTAMALAGNEYKSHKVVS